MKKILVLCSMVLFLACGCGKFDGEKAIKEFRDDVNGAKAYSLKGNMEIYSDEDTFVYSIEVLYKKDDMYRVTLLNQTNNHEQIILKNKDGVYVVTPSLNKSFKFQSEWPDNSSQAYLLKALVKDLEKVESPKLEESDDHYVLKAPVDYPNNPDLSYQKLYFDKKMNLEKVEVFNNDDIVKIKVVFGNIDYKAKIDDDSFLLKGLVDEECCKTDNSSTTGKLEDIIYPLYIPTNTYLTSKETLSMEQGDRVILTFAGDKNFVLVEEASKPSSEFEIIPVYGEPLMLQNTVAAMSANSLSWSHDNRDYYLASSDLTSEELYTIASSLSNTEMVSK